MFEFHGDRKRYFTMQVDNCEAYLIPFIEQKYKLHPGMRILEIGCGEGGVLVPFLERGCTAVGVELDIPRLELGKTYMQTYLANGSLQMIAKDIYQVNPQQELGGLFDVIILKDVIEHIHDQNKLIAWMKTFLVPNGIVFFGFPPWQMPFGGHQQVMRHKLLSKLPYFHLLPMAVYKKILAWGGEHVAMFAEIKETKISIEKFERLALQNGYHILHKTHYLINPIYKFKFGWKPKTQLPFISRIPWFRNFVTTCVYYCIQNKTLN
jgi:2-polyprenyl-3-methyl-5-hydroxy-6-metoxy-1,4-benzoquinol methylase